MSAAVGQDPPQMIITYFHIYALRNFTIIMHRVTESGASCVHLTLPLKGLFINKLFCKRSRVRCKSNSTFRDNKMSFFVVINRVWHLGFETFAKFFWGCSFWVSENWSQKNVSISVWENLVSIKKVSVSKYLISKTNESKWQERDKNKSKDKGMIICCWLWYWSLN